MYAFTRKILAFSAFLLIATALSPLYTPGQSTAIIQQRLEGMQERLSRLDKVPEELAAIRVEISELQNGQKEESERMWYVIMGILAAFAAKFVEIAFGVKIVKKDQTQP